MTSTRKQDPDKKKARAEQNEPFTRLTTAEALEMEPSLSPDIAAAAFLPDVRWVTGKQVCQALAAIIAKSAHLGAGKVLEGFTVAKIETLAGGVKVTGQDGTTLQGDKVVMCTGIGTPAIEGVPPDMPKSRPVRGVNLVLDQASLAQPITHLIKHHRGNLCPRDGNQLLSGHSLSARYANDRRVLRSAP